MATISLKIAGTSYTLQQASLRSLTHSVSAGQPASLAGEIYTTAIPSTALAHGDLVELWVNSTRRFLGWLGPVKTGFDAQGSYVAIEARDILHRLRNTPLTKRIVSEAFSPTASGLDHYIYTLADTTTTEVRLFGGGFVPDEQAEGYYRWEYGSSSEAQLARICAHASTAYSPGLDLGTTAGLSTKNQPEDVVNLDCIAALQRCTKYRPDAAMWVDASGTTPALHCITRDNCTAVTLDLSAHDRIRGWSLSAREDLRLLYLRWELGRRLRAASGSGIETTTSSLVYEFGDNAAPADRRSELTLDVGTYSSDTSLGIPVGEFPSTAASDYWAACSPLHWEGECTLYPPVNVDPYTYGLGQVHDFSGGDTALATCHALVRAASYDHVAGTVSLEYGPPDTLSPQDVLSGSASGAISATPPRDDPADPSATGSGDLPAHVTGGLAAQFEILSTTSGSQAIEGTASLVGFSAFADPAGEPPRKFLKRTHSGAYTIRTFAGDGTYITTTETHSGTIEFNPTNGTATGTNHRAIHQLYPDGSTADQSTNWGWDTDQAHSPVMQLAFPAYFEQPATVTSIVPVPQPGPLYSIDSCSIRADLFAEDSELAALDRLGAWADPVGAGDRKTFWEPRTSGYTFAARRCRLHGCTWTASVYGLPLKVTAPVYRYQFGSSRPDTPTSTKEWTLDLIQSPYTSTGAHGLTLTKYHGVATLPDWELPCERGYVVELGNLTATLL